MDLGFHLTATDFLAQISIVFRRKLYNALTVVRLLSKVLILYGFASIFAVNLTLLSQFFVYNCATLPMIFKLMFSTSHFSFPPFDCGKLCGNCVKPCISRHISTKFSKEPVENLVKRFLKTFYFLPVFLQFKQSPTLHYAKSLNIRLFRPWRTDAKVPF